MYRALRIARLCSLIVTIAIITMVIASPTQLRSDYQTAFAQSTTIETSADMHDDKFFGEAVLQVLITDTTATSEGTIETLTVSIDGKSDAGTSSTQSVTVPETSKSTGVFELFLVHIDATAVDPSDLDPFNSAGVMNDGTCIVDCAPVVTFGPGGDLDISADIYQDVRFEITAHDVHKVINYQETAAKVSLDRETYGVNSFVYTSIQDQDANLNPFERDEFVVNSATPPNEDLFGLEGGEFVSGDITFQETGDNTAVFKGKYQLGTSIDPVSESLVITLHEKANYDADLAVPENDSNNTDEISFTIGSNDGSIGGPGGQQAVTEDGRISTGRNVYAIGERIEVNVADTDANINPDFIDSVHVGVSSSSDQLMLLARETGQNTGVFEADFLASSNKTALPTSDQKAAIGTNQVTDTLIINYTDQRPADYAVKVAAGQDPSKVFTTRVDVHALKTGSDMTSFTTPSLKDANGKFLSEVTVGSQAIVSTTITNKNSDQSQPFVALVEFRDHKGVTVYLAWQSGTLDPNSNATIGLAWNPDAPGNYTVRIFAISALSGNEILSDVVSSQVVVASG